jgi:hypothetical protein
MRALALVKLLSLALASAACATGEEDTSPGRVGIWVPSGDGSAGTGATGGAPSDGGKDAVTESAPPPDAPAVDAPGEWPVPPPDAPSELAPCGAAVVVNEIQTSGPGGDDDEFVEIYNTGTCEVDVSEYQLVYRSASGTDDLELWHGVSKLFPGQFFAVGGKQYSYGAPDFQIPDGIALGAAGGGVALKKAGKTLDQVGWGTSVNYVNGTPASAPSSGKSIGRHPDGKDTGNNLVDFLEGPPSPRDKNK